MTETQRIVDGAYPFIIEWWIDGHWKEIGRCFHRRHAERIANKMTDEFQKYRVVEVRWNRVVTPIDFGGRDDG